MYERAKVAAKKPKAREFKTAQIQKSKFNNYSSPFDQILFLQRTIGNQAVESLLKSGIIQAKLKIGKPNDIYEQEADRVAEQIVSSSWSVVNNQKEEGEIQRQTEEEERKREEEETIQLKKMHGNISEVTPDIESRIRALKGSGQPLPKSIRTFFESRFGYDFSHVRIHTDPEAAKLARALNAEAFTYGRDIYFREGRYNPNTLTGKRLLAHELVHVVQQSIGIKHIQRDVILHNAGCPLKTLDNSKNSGQIGSMFGTKIAYGLTHFRIRTPGRLKVLGRMIKQNQGEIWVSNITIFPVAEVRMYLTNQFAEGSCEYDWTLGHEIKHWLGGCRIFESKLSLLQKDLKALPGPNTRQVVNGNIAAVKKARKNLENRVQTILKCFRIEVCREICRFNHKLDSHDYPRAFTSCPQPHPQVPKVPSLSSYLQHCNLPPANCPRPIK